MPKIAFIDHHLNNFHADTFLRLLSRPLADRSVEVAAAWESNPTGDDWCVKNGIRRADSLEDAVRAADAVLVLSPNDIDQHPALAARVLPFGKPTMIDKILAPTVAQAREIVDLARKHNAPVFSSSSLRYAVELEAALPELAQESVEAMSARGMGNWSGYGIHTLAMALRIMGSKVQRLIDTGTPIARTVTLDYGEGKRAVLDVRTAKNEWDVFGWSFAAQVGDRYVTAAITDFDGFYANLMRHASDFFATGRSDMPIEEALTAVAILEGADRSQAQNGSWISVESIG